MAGGLCKIHGTELNGFGSFSFCNECEKENQAQNIYEADKEVAEAVHAYRDEQSVNVIPGRYDILYDPAPTPRVEGWVCFGHQQPCQQRGDITITMGSVISTVQPSYYAYMGAMYRIDLASVRRCQLTATTYKCLKDITLHGDQLIHFNDRVLIGGIDHGPVP